MRTLIATVRCGDATFDVLCYDMRQRDDVDAMLRRRLHSRGITVTREIEWREGRRNYLDKAGTGRTALYHRPLPAATED